jgi:hypothetical protein
MEILKYLYDLSVVVIAHGIFFIMGYFYRYIPITITMRKFKEFFGISSSTNSVKIVYGMLQKPPSEPVTVDSQKQFEPIIVEGKKLGIGALEKIITEETVISSSYIVELLSRLGSANIPIVTDEKAFEDMSQTYISIGGPLTNKVSKLVLNWENNYYLKFLIKEDRTGDYSVVENVKIVNKVGKKNEFKTGQEVDYGFILKLTNLENPHNSIIVCAGIKAQGTSGSAWYLSNHWEELSKEFRGNDFGVVVEVPIGSDSSSRRVYTPNISSS